MSQSRDNVPNVPDGWKAIFDEEYKTWYYVDLKTKQSQWEPPKGTGFSRPAAPPPYEETGSQKYQSQQQQPTYSQQPVYYQQPTYPQQQPVYYQQQSTKKNNSGMMSGLMGAGIGLLGGAMLANALESHDRPPIIENNHFYGGDGGPFGGPPGDGPFGGDPFGGPFGGPPGGDPFGGDW